MIGKTLGHYQITDKLGEGGMGVVYKARDTHLDRFIALKILPPDKVADPDRKRRFVQEAKAASALNHPNIVHVYDIDQSEGTDFIAMEYVDGKTLDQRIGHRGLRLNDSLKYAVQITDALAKAHSAGIVHRDLKPTNIMVNEDGVVKVLDFGLAKLTEHVQGDETASTATIGDEGRPITEEGVIVGTVAYMSPEQAEGKKVDARSDVFSLGSVLYEMVTGQKAFQGTSKMSTLSAILHQEPKPVSGITPTIPADLEKLINRCLRKDSAKRWQTMADVKVALDELKEDSDSGRLQVAPAAARPASLLWLALVGVAVVVMAAAGWYWLRPKRSAEPQAVLTPVPLTSYPGYEGTPSFNPDGTQVAFEWCTEEPEINCDIYIKQIGFEPPFRLTTDRAVDGSPAWSPDGNFIAFLRRVSPTKAALIIIPQRGGQERVLGETNLSDIRGPYIAWTPDSKWLAFEDTDRLFLISVQTRERRRLTDNGRHPAFSPDGRALTFWGGAIGSGDVDLLHLAEGYLPQGLPELLMSSCGMCATTWTSDGSEILFSKDDFFGSGLWRMAASASASPRKLPLASEDYARWPAVSRHGNRLAYTLGRRDSNIWRVEMREPGLEPGLPAPLISSTKADYMPAYSPDGRKIAFTSTRSGAHEIWVCRSDGSDAVQLTAIGNAGAVKWSPDGRTIVYREGGAANTSVFVVSAEGGAPRRLTAGPFNDKAATFSRDGKSIYFASRRSGMQEIWKVPAGGGDPVQVTPNGEVRDMPQESPDGKSIYYTKCASYPEACSVWRMPVGGGEETLVLDSVHEAGQWAFWKEGIYFFRPADEKGRSDICLYEFATGKTRKVLTIEKPIDYSIEASPDGRTILYTQLDQAGSDLMLVENFR